MRSVSSMLKLVVLLVFFADMFQVLFSKAAQKQILELVKDPNTNDEKKHAVKILENTVNLINQV